MKTWYLVIIILNQQKLQSCLLDFLQKSVQGITSSGAEEDGLRIFWIFQQQFDSICQAFMKILEESATNMKRLGL